MKLQAGFVVLFVLSVFVFKNAAAAPEVTQAIIHFPKEKSEEFLEWTSKCISKGGFDSSVLDYVKEGKYTENDEILQALVCANTNIGYGYENGRINVKKVLTELFYDKTDIREVMEVCDKEYGSTPELNLKGLLLCLNDKLPYKVRV